MKFFLVLAVLAAFGAVASVSASSYEVKAVPEQEIGVAYCPNNCSYPFGQCDPNYGCRCDASHGTADCSVAIVPINSRQLISGTLTAGQWALYSIQVTDAYVQMLTSLTRTSNNGDPDLYIRQAQFPDRTHYDYADFSTGNLHSISQLRSASQLATNTYYIGVFAYGNMDTAFDLEVRLYQCPNDCNMHNGHGTCNPPTHTCSCSPGWVKEDCSAANVPLQQPFASLSTSLGAMEWMYFEMVVSQAQDNNDVDYIITVNKTSSATFGYIDLFASYNAFPDQNNFDYRSNLNSNLNQISICSSSLTAGVWRIAVQNWGFGPQNFTLNSQLVINCPNQCSGHGTCDRDGTCLCTPPTRWGGADCSYDLESALAGTTTVGTAVGLSFFFLILGAGPFIVWYFFGEKIKAFIASRRGETSYPTSSGNEFPAAATTASTTNTSSYQTF